MSTVTKLNKKDVENVQIDEAVIFLNYGLADERLFAPTRGGGEFSASVTIRDIDFDGRTAKTAGMQVIEEQTASLKVTCLSMTQENIALAVPGCVVEDSDGNVLENPACGIIDESNYIKNVTAFARLIGGGFKKIQIFNALHETGFSTKAQQKAEGEVAFEFFAHQKISDLNGKGTLWKIEDVDGIETVSTATPSAGDQQTITED